MEAKLDQLLVLVQKQQQQLIQQEERYSQLKKEIESLKGNATPEVIDATNSNESVVAPTENTWENAKKAVVKILVWIQEPDFQDPWQSKGIQQYGGSGAVIKVGEKLLIITNAHVIANHTLVQVQKCDDPTRKEAKVIFCSHESDLALVEVDDNFLDDMVPIDLAIGLPKLRDMIYVLGFPVGGDEISITEGVVSRIESQQYSHSLNYLLAVTVDAPINAGNSGGPVLKDNKLVGVAFQAISPDHAESIGHVVPIPVVNHFLECFLRKIDFRIPHLMISTQFFTNPLMRKEYGMDESQSGIVVTRVGYNNSCWEVLEPDDILLEVCGYKISNLGTIEWQNHRMAWYVVPQNLFVGDSCELVIMRKKKSMKVAIPKLLPEFSFLPYLIDKPPTYYIYCGFLFMQLTVDYLMVWGQNWLNDAPKELLNLRYEFPTPERTGIVIVSKVLAASINHGYEAAGDLVIVSVNGKKVKDIFDFVEKVETAETDTIDIRTTENYIFVLPSLKDNSTRELNNKLLEQYKIPSDRSLNLQKSSK